MFSQALVFASVDLYMVLKGNPALTNEPILAILSLAALAAFAILHVLYISQFALVSLTVPLIFCH